MRVWQTRGPAACLLLPIAALFGAVGALRRALYRLGVLGVERMPVPVVVVGNVFIGGTGKTPLTLWLIEHMKRGGLRPGIVSRGYGGSGRDISPVTAETDPDVVGDEPVLIAQRTQCPIMVGRSRAAAARQLLQRHPEVNMIICDDGLQHYALGRDIEIVVGDTRGVGNGWLLPAGPLREPATRRRDFTIDHGGTTVAAQQCFAMRLCATHIYQLAEPATTRTLADLADEVARGLCRIEAAAGIGHPQRFFDMLAGHGLVVGGIALPDHARYESDTFAALDADVILITEKDAVKCRRINALRNDRRLWVVPVDAELDLALAHAILEKIRGYPSA